ncbi:transposase [Xanthomonas theicola]|uniref:Transposase n=1 Tax=Xanthomonas theicola TaxID=56464 RepID=A0A2S6ZFK5_9XANT|nr:transposase [Xanthomonas theicola]PPT91023.1 transposase [Xanthomonas theicola]QNH24262.1 transposase [Xanthomonas theicola]
MSHAPRSLVDVEAELAHWKTLHGEGKLGPQSFSEHARLIKMACDVFLQLPRESNAMRTQRLRQRYGAEHPWPRITWNDAEALVLACWVRLDGSERRGTQPDPTTAPL